MQNFVGDDTPLGELVNGLIKIAISLEVKSQAEVLSYFRNNPCPENIPVTIVKRALAVLTNSQMYDF